MKHPNCIWIKVSEQDLAELISGSKPPEGIEVSEPQHILEGSDSSGGLFISFAISFAAGIPSSLIASWVYDCWKKRTKKTGSVNKHQIEFTKESIERLIYKQLADQKARDAQWAKDHEKPSTGS